MKFNLKNRPQSSEGKMSGEAKQAAIIEYNLWFEGFEKELWGVIKLAKEVLSEDFNPRKGNDFENQAKGAYDLIKEILG